MLPFDHADYCSQGYYLLAKALDAIGNSKEAEETVITGLAADPRSPVGVIAFV